MNFDSRKNIEGCGSNFDEGVANVNEKERVIRLRVSPSAKGIAPADVSVNRSNFERSGEPVRVMYYNEEGSWVDYSEAVVGLVKRCFLERKSIVQVNIGGILSVLDFYRMLDIDFNSGDVKSIAWIDVNGKCFFPVNFLGSAQSWSSFCLLNDNNADNFRNSNFLNIEIAVKLSGNSGDSVKLGKRGRENEEEEQGRSKIGRNELEKKPKWPNTRLLKEIDKGKSDMEYERFLLSAIRMVEPGAVITGVHRCVRDGQLEKARFGAFMSHLVSMKRMRGDPNLVFAWHGTSAMGVESILERGFDMSNRMQSPQAYGVGVHLSSVKFPHLSAMLSEMDSNGEKHLILCRVILGKSERVEASSQRNLPSSKDFDSGTDDLENPRWYVIWSCNSSTHILPELVVSYKPGTTIKGELGDTLGRRSAPVRVSIGDLISKLERSIPLPKVRKLQALYSSYKEGKMGKHIFAKHLRSLVGDEMIQSIVHDIRG